MKQKNVYVQSDVFYQVKPSELLKLEILIQTGAKYSPYLFNKAKQYSYADGDLAINRLQFTNLEIFTLLNKAINIVKDTEEYINYIITNTFSDDKVIYYSVPPGTIRFYDFDLICFYNGKVWRKIKF